MWASSSCGSSLVLWFSDPPTLVNSPISLHTPSPHSYTSSPLIPQPPFNYTHSFRTFFSPASLAHLFLPPRATSPTTDYTKNLPQIPSTHNHGLSRLSLFALIPYGQAYILNPKAPKGLLTAVFSPATTLTQSKTLPHIRKHPYLADPHPQQHHNIMKALEVSKLVVFILKLFSAIVDLVFGLMLQNPETAFQLLGMPLDVLFYM